MLEDKQNCESGTLVYNICICDFLRGHGVFENEFLQELVKSYWVAKVDLLLASNIKHTWLLINSFTLYISRLFVLCIII